MTTIFLSNFLLNSCSVPAKQTPAVEKFSLAGWRLFAYYPRLIGQLFFGEFVRCTFAVVSSCILLCCLSQNTSACENSFSTSSSIAITPPLSPAPFSRTYFSYFRRLGSGDIHALIANLKRLKDLGVTDLWISPLYPQTVGVMNQGTPHETWNDHGYWPSSFDVDPALGGWEAFGNLMKSANALGIRVVPDVVLDHVGYTETVRINFERLDGSVYDEVVSTKDPRYFRQYYNPQELEKAYQDVDRASNPEQALRDLDRLAQQKWDEHLPILNQEVPLIQEWLFHSYRKYIDHGVRAVRLDAFKHIPRQAILQFINQISAYCFEKYGEEMTFLAEHLTLPPRANPYDNVKPERPYNYVPVAALAEYFNSNVQHAKLLFIDFPWAFEARKIAADSGYSFKDLATFIAYRESPENQTLLKSLVGEVENHDMFLGPVVGSEQRSLIFFLTEFFASKSTILFHGGENAQRDQVARSSIDSINPNGDIGHLVTDLNNALGPYRDSPAFHWSIPHVADVHSLVVEKRPSASTSLFAIANRQEGERTFQISSSRKNLSVEIAYDSSKLFPNSSASIQVSTSASGETLIIKVRGNVQALVTVKR